MKFFLLAIASCLLVIGISGCVTMVTPAVNSTDISDTDFSQSFKMGTDCQTIVLLLFGPFGDASVVNAAKNGGISKVEVVDYQIKRYPFVFQRCVVVHGN